MVTPEMINAILGIARLQAPDADTQLSTIMHALCVGAKFLKVPKSVVLREVAKAFDREHKLSKIPPRKN